MTFSFEFSLKKNGKKNVKIKMAKKKAQFINNTLWVKNINWKGGDANITESDILLLKCEVL